MSDLQVLKEELVQDSEFKAEYEELQPEMDVTRAVIDSRINDGLTQVELYEKSGISK